MAKYPIETNRKQFTEAEYRSSEVKLMTPKKLLLGFLTTVLVFPPLAALKPTSASTLPIANPEANLISQGKPGMPEIPLEIDPIKIGEKIEELIHSTENREGFVKGLMEEALIDAKEHGYNVMVFNLQQDYETDIRNTAVFFKRVDYQGIPYGIWIFRTGKFINKGDAGWSNWAFYGRFKRDGNTVTFN